MFVVTVDFEIAESAMERFLPLMREQAANSLALEVDCHVFDVCIDTQQANKVFLYEVYTDLAAFEAHLQSAHFHAFNEAVAPITLAKGVRTFDRLEQGELV